MSKKHYVALAEALFSTRPDQTGHLDDPVRCAAAMLAWTEAVEAVANTCARFNYLFDRQRFLKAAGL